MAEIVKREPSRQSVDLFDQLFDDWTSWLPFRRPGVFGPASSMRDEMIRVDEYKDGEALVVRAEMPGIDPQKDVEITVSEGMLQIRGERREEQKEDTEGYRRRELRYGSFARSLPLPPGVKESDITAKYDKGMLEIRIPTPKTSATKVPVSKG
jgi:HSP20 family protein